jgi:hypothetical protein
MLWKNGVATELTDGSRNAMANALNLEDGQVRVAGYEVDLGARIARTWTDGAADRNGRGPAVIGPSGEAAGLPDFREY